MSKTSVNGSYLTDMTSLGLGKYILFHIISCWRVALKLSRAFKVQAEKKLEMMHFSFFFVMVSGACWVETTTKM